ncbi:MAG: discoidin domain-containing protein, partial [Candidatus Auribacterota bacterium]|nr:discoidin domain-containing protein [Candidatus Auribacterota bacterium]
KLSIRRTYYQRWVFAGLILLFIFSSLMADLWPARNVYFLIFHKADGLLTMELPIAAAMRYSAGHTENSCDSLPYMLLLKFIHVFIPGRLMVLRLASILSGLVSLVCLYRMSKALFGRIIASIFIFLLVTSPVFLEGMRSFGFIPFTGALAAISIYLLFSTLDRKRVIARVILLSGCSFLLLSGYALGRIAIVFPLVMYGLLWKRNWRKLIIYVVVLVVLIMVFDLAFGDIRFDIKDWFTVGTEWMMNRSGQPVYVKNFDWIVNNAEALSDYLLFHRNRTYFREPVFDDEVTQSCIFNPVYAPFFMAGLIICLVRRRRNHVYVLLWCGIFILSMLPTSELAMRRFIFALPPLYLILAVGLGGSYQLLSRLVRRCPIRKILLTIPILFLLATGGYDLHEFFFKVSRPACDYTSLQLEKVAEYIEKHGAGVSSIIIDGHPDFLSLTWGNPFFDPRVVRAETARKIIYEFQAGITLREQIDRARNEGIGALYLYPFFRDLPSQHELIAELKKLAKDPPPGVTVSRVPGVEMWGVIVESQGYRIPAAANRSYRYALPKNEQGVAVSSEYSWDNSHRHLLDRRPETYWKVAPPEVGKSVWVLFDLGRGGERAIRSLRARPRADRPEEFFHHASLRGSKDGLDWENVSRIIQSDSPQTGDWIRWDFDNETAYRFYRLEIEDGYTGREKNFISLAELHLGD